jgi:hypothetical protein
MTTHRPDWPARVRRALLSELNALSSGWREEGAALRDGNALVQVENRHHGGPGHVDIAFVLHGADGADAAPIVAWDCVSGGAAEDDAAAAVAARLWARTTAATFLELRSQRGDFATTSVGDPSLGLAGWHSVHGPIVAYGSGDPDALQAWLLEHPVVPLLGDELRAALRPGTFRGVKFIVGAFDDPIAEVRIDGSRDEACSEALLALPWPRAAKPCAARFFVLFVHPI